MARERLEPTVPATDLVLHPIDGAAVGGVAVGEAAADDVSALHDRPEGAALQAVLVANEGCPACGAKEGGCGRGAQVVTLTPPSTLLSTGDLARECGTTVRTVRFYEEAGLVEPTSRSDGGHRMFEPSQVSRLQLIMDLREAGLSLCDIKSLFELKSRASSAAEASERMAGALEAQIEEMQRKIAVLRRLREELAAMVAVIRECHDCPEGSFPKKCGGCDVMSRPDLPRAMRLLWSGR